MIGKNGIISGSCFNEKLQNFEIVGDINIQDDVASNFSSTNYIKVTNLFPQGTQDLDIKFKVNTTSIGKTQDILYVENGLFVQISMSGPLLFYKSAPQWVEIMRSAILSTNTDYYVHVSQVGSSLQCYYGTDKNNLTLIGTSTNLIGFTNTNNTLYIGGRGAANPTVGSLDLKELAISLGGNIIFAPATKTGISSYQTVSDEFYEI